MALAIFRLLISFMKRALYKDILEKHSNLKAKICIIFLYQVTINV